MEMKYLFQIICDLDENKNQFFWSKWKFCRNSIFAFLYE